MITITAQPGMLLQDVELRRKRLGFVNSNWWLHQEVSGNHSGVKFISQ